MLLEYIISNYMTLMVLSAVVALMIVNRKANIPATQLFAFGTILLLTVTVLGFVSKQAEQAGNAPALITLHTFADTFSYILRPIIIMTEIFIIVPDKRFRAVYAVPAAVNAVIFMTALFGSDIAFTIDENNHWISGSPLRFSVYVSQLIYVTLLLVHSIAFFRRRNIGHSAILMLIFVQSFSVAVLEFNNVSGFVDPVTALCILEYYIYLSAVYMQEMRETVDRKERDLIQSELMVLRNQIQPHFIYNSLNVIRYLVKHDSKTAVQCIDNFSGYLKAHIGAIQSDDMIPFEQELENVKGYLSLIQVDYTRKLDVIYDLGVTDFLIPPLSLEPIVENAVDHGINREGGTVTLRTYEENGSIVIVVSDSGSAEKTEDGYKPVHNGIGLENTRKRLGLQCGGTLDLKINENGASVVITLPKTS